ncbi:ADP-ribose diphosphatase [Aliidiomarina iranensis]|uniref:ADP-ribose pyrophosphatase n=1 Tax=Aliidiomarina iranensis TaxID=1434071 RepID=A0A432VU56_9GAMM|nr:NUDIX domain-containing protein [Aliidiomarina iranensis]RUO20008.1 ADP-ribose diphosphatase [Aliidiomarina iranensis]
MILSEFKQKDVEILDTERVYDGFFTVDVTTLRHRLFAGGWSAPLRREIMDRGNAVVVIPYDPKTDKIVLLEQFRAGAMASGPTPWLHELVAGMIEKGEAIEDVAHRELEEEAGLRAESMHYALNYLSSPGGMTERIYIYLARVDSTTASDFGGVSSENEDIKVQVLDRRAVMDMLEQGIIDNAATVIGMQWLGLHLNRFRAEWGFERIE